MRRTASQECIIPIIYLLLRAGGVKMDFLLNWSTASQIAFVVVVFSGLSVLGLYVVRMLVPLEHLKQNHEVAGFTFGVIGAFYGLLLAFVIVAAWERFDRAQAEVEGESVALISLYQLSKGLTQPEAKEMQDAIRAYTFLLWQIISNYKPQDNQTQLVVEKSIDQLTEISNAFSRRYLYSREDLPSVVWVVIYVGLFITIGFSYFFGLETFFSQALMCATFSSLLGLTLVAIIELAHPYQGAVTVSNAPFKYALSRMNDMDKVASAASRASRIEAAPAFGHEHG